MKVPHLLSLLSALGAAAAWAQVPDPTKPPVAEIAPVPSTASPSGAAAPAAVGVQAVFIRSPGKSGAMIDGQYVEVGDKLGDKRVLRVSESEVVLQGAAGREVVRMSPAVTIGTEKAAAKKTPKKGESP